MAINNFIKMRATQIPLEFICPLTRKIMVDPVVIQSGNTFEKEAIRKVLGRGSAIDPITGQRLGSTKMARNLALASLIKKQWGVEEKEKEALVTK